MSSLILLTTVFLNLFLCFFVITQDRNSLSNRFFALLSFLAAIWTFTNYMTGVSPTPFWLESTYATGSLVLGTGLVWTFILTETSVSKRKIISVSLFSLLLFFFSYADGFIASKYEKIYTGGVFVGEPGFGLVPYTIFFIFFAYLILAKLYKAQKRIFEKERKSQLLNVFYGALATLIISLFTSFLLPSLSIFTFGGLDSVGFLIFLVFIAYAIARNHLFSIKVIAAELLTFIIWGILFLDLFNKTTTSEYIESGFVLTFVVIAGIFLIKSVKKEVAQREQIEELAGRLKSVNRIMSHDIKNVLGKNKDMFGMLLDGTFGALSESARGFLERAHDDTKKLIRSVIVILESGQELKLKPAPLDLKEAVMEVVHDVEPDAKAKGLALTTAIDEKEAYAIIGDRTQLVTHVLRNLIENAIHYTLAGTVTVGLSKKDANTVLFSVKDTGIGISDEDKPNIFKEGGHGKDSIKVNVHSTGYGLYSVKRIVDAHGGKVWFETETGKGTTFWVELKMNPFATA